MAISPPGPPGGRPGFTALPPFGPHPRSRSRSGLSSPENEIMQAQRDAEKRTQAIQDQISQTERAGEAQVDQIRNEYDQQATQENSREETAIENQKAKGYENLRELQKAQKAEEARVKREGDGDLSRLRNYYRNTIYNTEMKGQQDLRDAEKRQFKQAQYEKRTADDAMSAAKQDQSQRYQQFQDDSNYKLQELKDSSRKQYEKLAEETAVATEKADQGVKDRFAQIYGQHSAELNRIQNESTQKLDELRKDTAAKLDAYQDRQEDPFYKMRDLDTKFTEEPDRYVLTARIPDYERQHVSVTVKGNELVISGYRRNEEKLKLEPGHEQSTSSFQSYMESFPLIWPVNARAMERQFDGDTLTVILPKKTTFTAYQPYHAKLPKRIEVQRPDFPPNLPHTSPDGEIPSSATASRSDGKEPGSGTLL